MLGQGGCTLVQLLHKTVQPADATHMHPRAPAPTPRDENKPKEASSQIRIRKNSGGCQGLGKGQWTNVRFVHFLYVCYTLILHICVYTPFFSFEMFYFKNTIILLVDRKKISKWHAVFQQCLTKTIIVCQTQVFKQLKRL